MYEEVLLLLLTDSLMVHGMIISLFSLMILVKRGIEAILM